MSEEIKNYVRLNEWKLSFTVHSRAKRMAIVIAEAAKLFCKSEDEIMDCMIER